MTGDLLKAVSNISKDFKKLPRPVIKKTLLELVPSFRLMSMPGADVHKDRFGMFILDTVSPKVLDITDPGEVLETVDFIVEDVRAWPKIAVQELCLMLIPSLHLGRDLKQRQLCSGMVNELMESEGGLKSVDTTKSWWSDFISKFTCLTIHCRETNSIYKDPENLKKRENAIDLTNDDGPEVKKARTREVTPPDVRQWKRRQEYERSIDPHKSTRTSRTFIAAFESSHYSINR
jgi:hypothetical protein